MDDADIRAADIFKAMIDARECGIIIGRYFPAVQRKSILTPDDAAGRAGLHKLGPSWITLSPDDARMHLQILLHHDMAYHDEMMSAEKAKELADACIHFLPGPAAYYSNCQAGWSSSHSWLPATHATFDSGIISIAAAGALVVWIMDED